MAELFNDNTEARAYDLSLFEPGIESRPRRGEVLEMPKKRENTTAKHLENFFKASYAIFIAVVIVVMFFCLLMCRVRLDEIGNDISEAQSQLAIAQSDYTVLSLELKSRTSVEKLEEKSEELGMDKLQKYQIQYFSVNDGDKTEIIEPEETPDVFSQVSGFIKELLE
ncbi:MAG: hypothetical protein IKS19_00705 [Clostridia bacterium]|nr:hypothetical protein [Clostridia bacterium]